MFFLIFKKDELVLASVVSEILALLMEAHPELAMTVDLSNTTALHTAATQGHIEVVNFLLSVGSGLATIARSNGKTALHSAARNGHLEVVRALVAMEPGIVTRIDKKGQTALHMAVKGQNVEVVAELIRAEPSSVNMVDTKGNTALHIATRKGRTQVNGFFPLITKDNFILFSWMAYYSEQRSVLCELNEWNECFCSYELNTSFEMFVYVKFLNYFICLP